MHRTQNPTRSAADTADPSVVTPADILRGAADYLETHGWTQQVYYGGAAADVFPPACADGAIGMAAYGYCSVVPCDNTTDPGYRDYNRAIDYMANYLHAIGAAAPIDPIGDGNEVIEFSPDHLAWNDTTGQSAESVIATLRAAADDYDRTHAVDADTEPLEDFLLDTGGYLACGCHGSQRDHTCDPLDGRRGDPR